MLPKMKAGIKIPFVEIKAFYETLFTCLKGYFLWVDTLSVVLRTESNDFEKIHFYYYIVITTNQFCEYNPLVLCCQEV